MGLISFLIITALAWPLAATGQQLQPSDSEKCNLTADEVDVYSATIQEVLLKDQDGTAKVILRERTSAGYPPGIASMKSTEDDEKDLLASINTETRADFDAQNKTSCILDPRIQPVERIQLLNARDERASLLGRVGGWKAFYKKYPGATGFTLLSRIGFDSAHDQALVYLGNSCGLLCGHGYLVVLRKHDGKWKVLKQGSIWAAG
jgi:hypothetical protein